MKQYFVIKSPKPFKVFKRPAKLFPLTVTTCPVHGQLQYNIHQQKLKVSPEFVFYSKLVTENFIHQSARVSSLI